MHIHKLEKIWLSFGITMLAVFLVVLGISTFAFGLEPPSHSHSIDPQKVRQTAPFDQPGIREISAGKYEAVIVAYAFGYDAGKQPLEIPAGATVDFVVTTPDVVHGLQIPGTNVNVMVVPGEVSHISHTFDQPGEYLILCNEYCGGGHEFMYTTIVVS